MSFRSSDLQIDGKPWSLMANSSTNIIFQDCIQQEGKQKYIIIESLSILIRDKKILENGEPIVNVTLGEDKDDGIFLFGKYLMPDDKGKVINVITEPYRIDITDNPIILKIDGEVPKQSLFIMELGSN